MLQFTPRMKLDDSALGHEGQEKTGRSNVLGWVTRHWDREQDPVGRGEEGHINVSLEFYWYCGSSKFCPMCANVWREASSLSTGFDASLEMCLKMTSQESFGRQSERAIRKYVILAWELFWGEGNWKTAGESSLSFHFLPKGRTQIPLSGSYLSSPIPGRGGQFLWS